MPIIMKTQNLHYSGNQTPPTYHIELLEQIRKIWASEKRFYLLENLRYTKHLLIIPVMIKRQNYSLRQYKTPILRHELIRLFYFYSFQNHYHILAIIPGTTFYKILLWNTDLVYDKIFIFIHTTKIY